MCNPIKVLIVDDSALMRQLLTQILRSDPEIEVVGTAMDPFAARDKIRTLVPDVLTLDVEMPRVTGPEMAHLMLLRDCGKEFVPVVLLSGIVGLPNVAHTVGTPYFLAKPYRIEDVLPLIDRALTERIPPHPEKSP